MKRFKDKKRYRLEGFDYSLPGYYFVTIVTFNRIPWFGNIGDDNVVLTEIGSIAKKYFNEIPNHFNNVRIDEFIVMPDHVHGIVVIEENGIFEGNIKGFVRNDNVGNDNVGTRHGEFPHGVFPQYQDKCFHKKSKPKYKQLKPLKSNSLSLIINQYKGSVKRYCNKKGHEDFKWQSKFYDRIIRNDFELYSIRQYIKNNIKKHKEEKDYEEFV